jgi:hypothetical protein
MIDKNKTYKTRRGHAVRIYATDGEEDYPVHGAIYLLEKDKWRCITWTDAGHFMSKSSEHDLDIIESRQIQVRWLNVYDHGFSSRKFQTKEAADELAVPHRIACVRVEYYEGEGL